MTVRPFRDPHHSASLAALVGGELAKAAFDHGFEEYGVDILKRYHSLVSEKGESYLWYFPDGTPASVETSTSPEAEPTDGWGSSAVLYALIAGLAGVEDEGGLVLRDDDPACTEVAQAARDLHAGEGQLHAEGVGEEAEAEDEPDQQEDPGGRQSPQATSLHQERPL